MSTLADRRPVPSALRGGPTTRALRLATCAVFAAAAAAGQGIVAGDPAKLVATLAGVEACGEKIAGALVAVKVVNRGAVVAEPLVFELKTKGGVVRLRRCPGPYVGRLGRGLAVGATGTYPLLHRGAKEELLGAAVAVVEASFHASAQPLEDPVIVGPLRQEKRVHEAGATVDFGVVPLRNRSDRTLDVAVRVAFERPAGATTLLHRRLAPGQEIEATTTDVEIEPPSEAAPEGAEQIVMEGAAPRGARPGSATIVDWVAAPAPGVGAAEAAAAFRAAYAPWIRWTRGGLALKGSFRLSTRRGAVAFATGGAFTVGERTDPVVTTVTKPSDEAFSAAREALAAAFRDLKRPSVEDALAAAKPRPVRLGTPTFLACDGEPWTPELRRMLLAVDGPRFVRVAWDTDPAGLRTDWVAEAFDDGYVVARRSSYEVSTTREPTTIETWRYARAGATVVPAAYARVRTFPAPETLDLVVEGVREEDAASPPVAPSPAAEAVRRAWDEGYKHPATTGELSGRFRIKAGKDGLWRGRKEVAGAFVLRGFGGARWDAHEITLDGESDERVREHLAFVVADRLRIWTNRDFAARAAFEVDFAGASFAERAGAAGVYDVTGGPFSEITLKDGRVVGTKAPGGRRRTIGWTKVGGKDAAARFVADALDGTEDVAAELVAAGPFLVPSRLVFKGVFGGEKEWGTEEVELKALRFK